MINGSVAQIELRRFYEYARLAINKEELLVELNKQLVYYGLTMEDVQFFGDEMEAELDD